jgi:hypothetical protein
MEIKNTTLPARVAQKLYSKKTQMEGGKSKRSIEGS